MTGMELALTVGGALMIAAIGWGAKSLVNHSASIAALKESQKELKADTTEIKSGLRDTNNALQRLLGRQEERNGHS